MLNTNFMKIPTYLEKYSTDKTIYNVKMYHNFRENMLSVWNAL